MSDTQNPSAPPCEIVQRLRAASLLDGWAWLNEAADAIERPEPGIIMAPIDIDFLSTRFWHKVEKFGDDGCWAWRGPMTHGGYGVVFDGKRRVRAHRVSWTMEYGPIPQRLVVDHLCHNRVCVNPRHLQLTDHRTNSGRQGNGLKTHCKFGHEFTPENTYLTPDNFRRCRPCDVVRARANRAEARENRERAA